MQFKKFKISKWNFKPCKHLWKAFLNNCEPFEKCEKCGEIRYIE